MAKKATKATPKPAEPIESKRPIHIALMVYWREDETGGFWEAVLVSGTLQTQTGIRGVTQLQVLAGLARALNIQGMAAGIVPSQP